jgi:uncharacterized protein
LFADPLLLLLVGVFVVAVLYASVGHAGASGYIAIMALVGMAPEEIKPTALAMNILVAAIGSWQFWRAGHFRWALFWPFALLAAPMAFLGGWLALPGDMFKLLIGVILLWSAAVLWWRPRDDRSTSAPAKPVAIVAGGALGFVAGLTGTGGGIFLTPLLLLMRWAHAKEAAAVSALFILVNSSAGLLGNVSSTRHRPGVIGMLLVAAAIGGAIGAHLGSRRLPAVAIKRVLGVVLLIAGAKLLAGG